MKKTLIAIAVIVGLILVGYLGNIVLMAVGGSVGNKIIEAIPEKDQYFTADQETFVTQLNGNWVQETDTKQTAPMTIKSTKEDLTIIQTGEDYLVYPAKHVKITKPAFTLYNLGQKPNMDLELVDSNTLLVPNLNATNDTQPSEPVIWKRLN
ncbi:hypothetical protein I6N95_26860 [Vagococcus sp. BWB3-3]|uniref:Uncharacterized protein n=1 Tax=Vagococcus allomyrinae TaxID=2794353 RepID=A0A940SUS3_9ENTE|nr:hypothetical protein [Vagococcus allomyrinae]MBP1044637.1 hypothetical protein [Vagococcus allomyrinae]